MKREHQTAIVLKENSVVEKRGVLAYLKGSLKNLLHKVNIAVAGYMLDCKELSWMRGIIGAKFLNGSVNLALHLRKEDTFIWKPSRHSQL